MSSGRVGQAFVLTCFFTAGYGRHKKLGVGFRTAGYDRHRSQWVNSTSEVWEIEKCLLGNFNLTFTIACVASVPVRAE